MKTMRSRADAQPPAPGCPGCCYAPGTASPAAGRPTGRRLIAAMLIAAAALDLTRCSLVLMTFRRVAPTVGLVAAGIGAAGLSVTAARGCQVGQRWAAWAALLIGVASAPQASASGFHTPYTVPDVATAALGVLLTVAILASAGRTGTPAHPLRALVLATKDCSEVRIGRKSVPTLACGWHGSQEASARTYRRESALELSAVLSLVACVPCGLAQCECDDERKQGLDRGCQSLDQAEVTAAVPGCDQEPARQPCEDHGHRRAAVDTEDPRSGRPVPGDKHGPDGCHDDAAHRKCEVARRRARGRFRRGGDAESRKASQDQQDARRHADVS
jgi:hypothetical protein